jgi:hypothetical protein
MSITIDGGAGVTFPDNVQQTNGMTNTGGNPRYYAARAWVNFAVSAGGITIRGASNVSSVSDGGTGIFTVNFTTNMPDAFYAVVCTVSRASDPTDVCVSYTSATVSSVTIRTFTRSGGAAVDASAVNVVIFR